jgi:hypothetical protein
MGWSTASGTAVQTAFTWARWCARQQRLLHVEPCRQEGAPFGDRELARLSGVRCSTSDALRASRSPSNTATPDQETRLHGRRLLVVRGLIFIVIGITLGLYLLALPGLYLRLSVPCTHELDLCLYFPEQVAPLAKLGLTPSSLIGIVIAVSYASILLVCGVAAVLIWRRSDDWMALFLALTLILMPANFTPVLGGLPDALQGLGVVWSDASSITLYLLLGLFPSGRFVPRWLRLPILVLVLQTVISLSPPADTDAVPSLLVLLVGLGISLVSLGAEACLIGGQIYRYRRVATPLQRQQIKWGVYGLVLTILVNQVFWQPVVWIPALQRHDSLYILLAGPDSFLMICILAISFGVAVLRYRLYDIDTIINRALVYGALTAILAVVYTGCVIGLQAAVNGLTRTPGEESSPPVIVVTTLLIAALFQPLRRRLQTVIDRRFYRHKYDVATVLAAFGATLRQEVDLGSLQEQLAAVVQETMQPSEVSLWLRPTPTREQPEHF